MGDAYRMAALARGLCAAALAAVAALPLRAQSPFDSAQDAYQHGRMEAAYRLVERAAAAWPDSAAVQELRGDVACQRATGPRGWEHPALARECGRAYARAVALAPDSLAYLESLVGFLRMAPRADGGDLDSALAVAERERDLDVGRGTFQMAAVLRRGDARQRGRADSLIHAVSLAHPDDPELASLVAVYYESQSRSDSVLAVYERLAAASPGDAAAQYLLGRQLVIMKRDPRRAQTYLLNAAMAPPPDPGDEGGVSYGPGAPWWRLGQTWEQLGRPDSARVCFREALRLQPGFPEAQASLDSLARRSGGRRGG